eukprot:3469751-Prymnesium_polylepis.1
MSEPGRSAGCLLTAKCTTASHRSGSLSAGRAGRLDIQHERRGFHDEQPRQHVGATQSISMQLWWHADAQILRSRTYDSAGTAARAPAERDGSCVRMQLRRMLWDALCKRVVASTGTGLIFLCRGASRERSGGQRVALRPTRRRVRHAPERAHSRAESVVGAKQFAISSSRVSHPQ